MHLLSQFLKDLPQKPKVKPVAIFHGETENSIFHQVNKFNLTRAQVYQLEQINSELAQVLHILKTTIAGMDEFVLIDKKPLLLAANFVHGFVYSVDGAIDSDVRSRSKGGAK